MLTYVCRYFQFDYDVIMGFHQRVSSGSIVSR